MSSKGNESAISDAIKAAMPVDKSGDFDPYADQNLGRVGIKDGRCVSIATVKTETGFEKSYRPLLNGILVIVGQEIHDDGDTQLVYFVIKGRTEKGRDLPTIRIPATKFQGMAWIPEHYGNWLIMAAGHGNKDVLRYLIQAISMNCLSTTIYTHTGFRVIDGKLRYLTASGGIGADGLDTSINVRLPGNSAYYDLPEPTNDPYAIVKDAKHLLSIAPDCKGLGAALLGLVFSAPLTDIAPTNFVVGIFGESGSGKSALGGVVQSFFGAGFYKNIQPAFPSNFHDTGAAIGVKLHRAKNILQVIDEFTLNGSAQDASRTQDKLKDIVFNVGNSMGRDKCAPDMSAIPATPPRGSVLVLGESLPKGGSILARMLVIEIRKGDIDFSYLTTLQQLARAGRFAVIMACYIQWLIGRYGTKRDYPKTLDSRQARSCN